VTELVVSDEVSTALAESRGVVALESTIFSNLGLPSPHNADALARCEAAIRDGGAVPAVTAVLDGVARVGLDASEHERILGAARKVAARDLPVAMAQRWEFGATTVSASLTLASAAGIGVFATGGIGGVHRGVEETGDVSADLGAIAAHPIITVCAGAKVFLDLPRTLEWLETAGVPVLGWQTDELPGFTTPTTGISISHRVESADEVRRVVASLRTLGMETGVLVAVPVPTADGLDPDEIDAALTSALEDAEHQVISGAAITPFVLGRIAAATEGRSIPANLALAENNARVAALLAVDRAQPR
jgi:pseudouridine-5'-phosphate glycosidase